VNIFKTVQFLAQMRGFGISFVPCNTPVNVYNHYNASESRTYTTMKTQCSNVMVNNDITILISK
jgi:hypothetical protein